MEIFRLQVDSSKMNAYLGITKMAAIAGNVTPKLVVDYLKSSGIVFGINEEIIHKMIEREFWDKQIKVAVGIPPQKGEDGEEKFYFDTVAKLKPKVLEDGSVDFKDVHLAQNVEAGQKIAERIPPTIGISGINIYGEEVLTEPGVEGHLAAGANTEFTDEERNILIASVDGCVKLRPDNTVVVDTIFQVEKDVDYSTGNLEVTGDIIIRGSVLSGFAVKSNGNVTVNGFVEDAIIEVDGDVMVRMGFSGTGKGMISAGGKVVIKYVNNQTVNAEEISIGEESLHANLNAVKSINITRGKGTLIGGHARAGKTIEVNTCGCDQGILTTLIVAENAEIGTELDRLDENIKENDEKNEENMQRIMGIMERVSGSDLTDSQKRFLRSIEKRSEVLNEKNVKLIKRKEELEKDICVKTDNAYIKINKKIYPRTRVQIAWFKLINDTIREKSVYRLGDNCLVVSKDLEESTT
jgi:hypothetical protein